MSKWERPKGVMKTVTNEPGGDGRITVAVTRTFRFTAAKAEETKAAAEAWAAEAWTNREGAA